MKKPLVTVLMAAILITSAPLALAGDRDDHRRDRNDHATHDQRHGQSHDQRERRDGHERRDQQRWSRGDHLPAQYRGAQHVVKDWQGHHLQRPAAGYQWVSVDSHYLLVGIASGLIIQTLLNH